MTKQIVHSEREFALAIQQSHRWYPRFGQYVKLDFDTKLEG